MKRVVISREWAKGAPILVKVTEDDISIDMLLDDYLEALVAEIGNPATLFTTATLRKRVFAASVEVNRKMKQTTSSVL